MVFVITLQKKCFFFISLNYVCIMPELYLDFLNAIK